MFIFDFAGTLANLYPSKEFILKNFLKRNNINVSLIDIKKAYYKIDNELFYSSVKIISKNKKKLFYNQFNRKLFNILNIENKPLAKKFYNFFLKKKKYWRLEYGVRDFLKKIKKKKIKVSLISNFDSKLIDILKKKRIHKYFDYLHISQNNNSEKPSINFYKSFFLKYGIPLKSSIYFGDNYKLDYLPAKKLNLKFFLIDKNNLCQFKIKNRLRKLSDYSF
jgi:putative hydrolase of the HAD superfamily